MLTDMKSTYAALAPLFCAFLIAHSAFAKDESDATKWLSKEQEQTLSDSVQPPPVVDSAEDKADNAQVLAAQSARTPEIIAECKRDQTFGYKLFEDVYGKDLTEDHAPKFHKLMKTVLAVTSAVNETAKKKYQRLRPYQQHPDTVHALFTVNGFSYPSGHSMGSFTLAVVLGAVFPDKQQAFLDRATQIAQSRVDAGVHSPSDIKEGEALGKATGAAIVASPAFQADLAQVKAELAK
jgi:acid phosphatase (class A)